MEGKKDLTTDEELLEKYTLTKDDMGATGGIWNISSTIIREINQEWNVI